MLVGTLVENFNIIGLDRAATKWRMSKDQAPPTDIERKPMPLYTHSFDPDFF